MKHVLTGCAGCALMMLVLSGCGPELAQTQLGAEEEQWQTQIRNSYSSWRAPRSAPPAVSDNRDPSLTARPAAAEESSGLTVESKDAAADKPAPDTVGIPKDTQENAPAAAKPADEDTTTVSPAPANGEMETYTVQKGDTLSKLAKIFYGDGRRYMPIIKANEATLKGNANRIYPGMKLNIPKR